MEAANGGRAPPTAGAYRLQPLPCAHNLVLVFMFDNFNRSMLSIASATLNSHWLVYKLHFNCLLP